MLLKNVVLKLFENLILAFREAKIKFQANAWKKEKHVRPVVLAGCMLISTEGLWKKR